MFQSVTMWAVACLVLALPTARGSVIVEKAAGPVKCIKQDDVTGRVWSEVCGTGKEETEEGKMLEYFCHTVWSNETGVHPSGLAVRLQGCIGNQGGAHDVCRNSTTCVDNSSGKGPQNASSPILHCCCTGNNCNAEFWWRPTPVETPSAEAGVPGLGEPALPSTAFLLLYTLVPLFVVLVVAAAACYVYHQRKHAQFASLSVLGEDCPASPPTPTLTHRPVQLLEIKARGRFGAVWKGQLGKDMVAVKIFPLQDKQSWFAEQEIYNLPQMNHENILRFMGVDRRGENLQMEFWLVTAFHDHGSLCDFLKTNILQWEDLVKISLTMARGLAHLHSEIPANKGAGVKPATAHRDFKSKNVLIKSDLTACIGDFGLALQFRPNEVVGDTHGQVGTRRYMAPEVLEGAINFSRDAFLRIDMYACGLVLWELATRCNVLGPPQDYKHPFEAEASPHPSLEEISDLVVSRKVRPEIRKAWRAHAGLSVLCETIEECWDHDAEARLSSSCVVERLQHMKLLGLELGGGQAAEFAQSEAGQLGAEPGEPGEQVRLISLNSCEESGSLA